MFSEVCGAELCAGKPSTPSDTCKACLGYAAQICNDVHAACKSDQGEAPPAPEKL